MATPLPNENALPCLSIAKGGGASGGLIVLAHATPRGRHLCIGPGPGVILKKGIHMNNDIEHQVRQIAADVLNLPLARVTRETSPDTVQNWDSVQHLNFVLALEAAMGIQLEPQDIERIRTVGAAIDVMDEKKKY